MIKRKLLFVLMLVVLAATVTDTAVAKAPKKVERRHKKKTEAQDDEQPLSRKEEKRLKKEQRRKEKANRKKQREERRYTKRHKKTYKEDAEDDEPAPKPDDYPLTKMKSRYRVDILAPLYLDELVKDQSVTFKNKIPEKAEQGLAFYEGILIAADSLKKAGFKIDVYMHDITSAKEAPGMLVAEGTLDSSDLIIGDVQAADIPLMAAYARKIQVNFVSTSSLVEGAATNNPYFTLMVPSLKSHCEWIADNLAVKHPGARVALLYRTNVPTDEDAYTYLTANKSAHFSQISCNQMPAKSILSVLFDTTKPNVVVIPVMDIAYADSLLTVLSQYFPSARFTVYGMPSWTAIADLRKERAFPNLAVNVTVPFYVSSSSASAKYVSRIHRRDYGGKTSENVYKGYETLFWYANLLKSYGTVFNVKYEDNTKAPFTSFDIRARKNKKGNIQFYENKHVFLTKYEGGVNKTE